jgi:hypothetical protein
MIAPLETWIDPHDGCYESARIWADAYQAHEAEFAGEVASIYMALAAQSDEAVGDRQEVRNDS